jgi:hypothetical protein
VCLTPFVVSSNGWLRAVRRRLEAVRQLGWKTVPVYVRDDLKGLLQRLQAERDENTCRKDFTKSEAVALGKELEKLERKEAVQRRQEGRKKGGKTAGEMNESDHMTYSGRFIVDDRRHYIAEKSWGLELKNPVFVFEFTDIKRER